MSRVILTAFDRQGKTDARSFEENKISYSCENDAEAFQHSGRSSRWKRVIGLTGRLLGCKRALVLARKAARVWRTRRATIPRQRWREIWIRRSPRLQAENAITRDAGDATRICNSDTSLFFAAQFYSSVRQPHRYNLIIRPPLSLSRRQCLF